MLKDHQWDRMEPHLPGKRMDPGRTAVDSRLFVEAVLWLARTGSPWRDLPELFGNWRTAPLFASRAGPRAASGIGCLPPWPMSPTSNTS